jgi:hypothetical protein
MYYAVWVVLTEQVSILIPFHVNIIFFKWMKLKHYSKEFLILEIRELWLAKKCLLLCRLHSNGLIDKLVEICRCRIGTNINIF